MHSIYALTHFGFKTKTLVPYKKRKKEKIYINQKNPLIKLVVVSHKHKYSHIKVVHITNRILSFVPLFA